MVCPWRQLLRLVLMCEWSNEEVAPNQYIFSSRTGFTDLMFRRCADEVLGSRRTVTISPRMGQIYSRM
jgi:hypothetical protein